MRWTRRPIRHCSRSGLRVPRTVLKRAAPWQTSYARSARNGLSLRRPAPSPESSPEKMGAAPTIAEGLFTFRIGGSERVGIDLALEFKRRGYQVVCFAFHDSDGPMRPELELAGIRCVDLNVEKFRGPLRHPLYFWKFWRMLRKERVRALHVHHHGAMILCGIPARLAGVTRVVMTEHGLQALVEREDARRLTMRYC